ncbi:MAG TPA: ATP-binding cassette domain-containing protein [Caulobacteraceae bacterium]|nr:ATP-binding cassette domain-containing protein [Caulobacteraceae bacterium]
MVRLLGAAVRLGRAGRTGPPLSLDLEPGSAHVITAGPGAGKSAMLETIALARPPARGAIELFGRNLAGVRPSARYALRRRIGMIFQDLRLIDALSARDNVALAARAAGRPPEDYEKPLAQVLSWVGLARLADEPASHLDAEGRGRLAVARAVINAPDLLIADEPGGEAVLKLLSDLNEAGTTMLIATRDTELAEQSGAEVTALGAPP